jgi:O-antigen ligase
VAGLISLDPGESGATEVHTLYASVVASASRAGFVIATIEIVVLLVVGIRRKRMEEIPPAGRMTAAIAVLVAIGGGVVGWNAVLERFQVKDLFAGRREFLQSTLRMIHDRPWLGFGLGSWPWVYPRYAIFDPVAVANHAHNDWVEWASEGGILFAALIALVALRGLWLSLEMPWGIGVVAVFAHAAVDFPFQRPPLLVAVLLVLVVMEIEHARRS